MSKYECTRCGEQYSEDVDFCSACGFPDVNKVGSSNSYGNQAGGCGCMIFIVVLVGTLVALFCAFI